MPHASTLRKQPSGKWEIEFTAGVWTDVTADVDQRAAVPQIRFGRTSEFSAPAPSELTVTLRNFDRDASGAPLFDVNRNYVRGNYTPQDQTSPYWPNIVPRKRIRYSYNPGVQRFRFTGYIKSWQPLLLDGSRPYMQITAIDRMDQLSRVTMLAPITQEITLDKPLYWWPLTDPAGSTFAAEQSGHSGPGLPVVGTQTNPLIFGDLGPGFGDGTGVHFAGPTSAQALQTTGLPTISFSGDTGLWLRLTANPGSNAGLFNADNPGTLGVGTLTIGLNTSGQPFVTGPGSASITSATGLADAKWHHVFLSFAGSVPLSNSYVYTLYVDGVSVGTQTVTASPPNFAFNRVTVGGGSGMQIVNANLGQVAVFILGSISTTRITAHYQAGLGYSGDRTDQRVARFLGYAGLTTSDWNLDTGQAIVGTYPQDGKDILSACQDMAATEGGGAAVYVTSDGKVRFINRRYRDNRTPKLTVDAVNDLDGTVYAPSFDDLNLITSSTVSRSNESGTQSTQTYSITSTFGVFSDQITSYATTDQDALNLAQYDVNSRSTPALRFPQIAVDLATSFNNLYDQMGQLQIGDRVRLQNIPGVAYPQTTVDFFFEGLNESPDVDSYKDVLDVSPADNPPRWKWDTSDWQPTPGSMTLNAGITNTATTLAVATTAGNPTFTTGASYPVTITIGGEDITLNSAPGGATSPQTFTGVTRGVNGTTAAAQSAAAAVTLAAPDAWSL